MDSRENAKISPENPAETGPSNVHVRILKIYVDRSEKRWIVLDSHGEFWDLPFGESSWERRRRIDLVDDLNLEPIPGHYKYRLGLPA